MAKEQTHIQVNISDKETLERLRDEHGYASIRVVVGKLIKECGDKLKG